MPKSLARLSLSGHQGKTQTPPNLASTTTYSSVGGTTYPDAQIVLGALGPLHMRPSKLKRRTCLNQALHAPLQDLSQSL